MTTPEIGTQHSTRVGFDVCGCAAIQVLDASPADLAGVSRQLGLAQAPLTREPDIRLRFVDRLTTASRLRYVGLDDAGFTDEAFWVLRSRHKTRVQIPLEQIGGQCEIICERGAHTIPFLTPIVHLTALARGALPIHASAFTYAGTGVLVTGWSRGGKTGALLTFMAHGASFISDDWVYLAADGRRMHGSLEPIQISDHYLHDLPQYRRVVSRTGRARLRGLQLALAAGRMISTSTAGRFLPARLMQRALSSLSSRAHVSLPPQQLFGQEQCALAGDLERIFLTVSHASPELSVQPVGAAELAGRMTAALQHELLDFMACYYKFKFAFPGCANAFIEGAEALQRERLAQLLGDKQAYIVYHPYPAPLQALFETLRPFVSN